MAIEYPKGSDDWQEWVRKWWDSMLIIPKKSNPINDSTGENFKDFDQPADDKDVWFLAGNLGGSSNRKIKVKKGKALFFPEVNFIGCEDSHFGGELRGEVEDSLYFNKGQPDPEKDAREDITASEKDTSVDYEGPIKQRIRKRVPVSLWTTEFGNPPVMGRGSGRAKCLSDGFWVFTEPLNEVGKTAYITITSKHSDIKDSEEKHHSFNSTVMYEIEIVD